MKIQLKDERGKVCIVVTDKEVIMHDPKYKEDVDYIKKYGVTTGTAGEEKPDPRQFLPRRFHCAAG